MKISEHMHEDDILKEISQRIRQQRILLNVTQAQLAKKCGTSLSTIVRIENGDDPKLSNIIKIMRGLGMSGNLDVMIPEPKPDYKAIFEQKPVRQRASVKRIVRTKPWIWGEDK